MMSVVIQNVLGLGLAVWLLLLYVFFSIFLIHLYLYILHILFKKKKKKQIHLCTHRKRTTRDLDSSFSINRFKWKKAILFQCLLAIWKFCREIYTSILSYSSSSLPPLSIFLFNSVFSSNEYIYISIYESHKLKDHRRIDRCSPLLSDAYASV